MHIVIEALGIDLAGGTRSATLNLLDALFRIDAENFYTLFLSRPEPSLNGYSQVRQVTAGPMHAMAARLWVQTVLPRYLRSRHADLVHHVKNLAIIGAPCPSVVTLHDLTILYHPEIYPRFEVWFWRHLQPHLLRRATRLIAISKETAYDLRKWYRLPSEQVEVIYDALNGCFFENTDGAGALPARYGIHKPYILHLGSISRKKNLPTLVRAYERLRKSGDEHQLVLVGRVYQKGYDDELARLLADSLYAKDIIQTGAVPDADVLPLYRSAAAVAFPSFHEGFGLVPIEAMACGVPVVSSAGGALGEVVGDGGWILKDMTDDGELAHALHSVLHDHELRQTLIDRGLKRARKFSPQATAVQTLDLYRRLAGNG